MTVLKKEEIFKEFGKNIGKIVKDFLPSLDNLKSAGGKVLGGIKSLFSSESEEDKIDAAVQAALQQHFETFHQRADAMNENALNKIEGGQTTVVTTASIDNSNNSKVESVQHNMKQIAHTDPIQQQIANAT